jgi:hypothetical protein
VSTCQPCGPHLVVLPRVPSCPAFGTSQLLMSRRGPLNLRISECVMCDEALIQWSSLNLDPMTILSPRDFATSRLGAPNLWALTLRTFEFTKPTLRLLRHFCRSFDCCHLSSSDGRLRSNLAFSGLLMSSVPTSCPQDSRTPKCRNPDTNLFWDFCSTYEGLNLELLSTDLTAVAYSERDPTAQNLFSSACSSTAPWT